MSVGPYRLLAAQRLLLEGDKPVRLGGRAFDILIALIERAGNVVSKEELIAQAWPTTFVDEANLKIQVSALRRALGDGQGDNRYIATVARRGPCRGTTILRPRAEPCRHGQALDRAREQGALSWELRAATSLARLLRHEGRFGEAIACLRPIYDRFTEGFDTADLIAAKQLLDDLGVGGER